MMMKHIVIFFLCLPVLTECFARQITLQDIPEKNLQRIYRCDDMVRSVFKLKKRNRKQKALHIRYGSEPAMTMTANTVHLHLRKNHSFIDDPDNCQALFSALLLSSGALDLNPEPVRALPLWLCAGMNEKVRAYQQAERYLHGLNAMPAVEAMYEQNRLPDLKKLPELRPAANSSVWKWYSQYARLLLEEAIDRKLLPAYGARLLQTADYSKESAEFHKKLLYSRSSSPKQKKNITIAKILWNLYHPEPAHLKLQQLEKLLQWQIPELTKDGQPTDKFQTISLTALHDHIQNRSDASEQRKIAAGEIQNFRTGCTRPEIRHLQQLYFLLYNPSRDLPRTAELLDQNVKMLREELKKRAALEKMLREAESRHTSVTRTLSGSLRIVPPVENATGEQIRFLMETEQNYGD